MDISSQWEHIICGFFSFLIVQHLGPLFPQGGIEPVPPAVEAQSSPLDHQENPSVIFYNWLPALSIQFWTSFMLYHISFLFMVTKERQNQKYHSSQTEHVWNRSDLGLLIWTLLSLYYFLCSLIHLIWVFLFSQIILITFLLLAQWNLNGILSLLFPCK